MPLQQGDALSCKDETKESESTLNMRGYGRYNPQKEDTLGLVKNQENENSISVVSESNDLDKDAKRWDLIFLAYIFSIFSTIFAFGASHNFEYNYIIFFFVFSHFAAETVISWNFIFSSKIANYLSIMTTFVYFVEAFMMIPLGFDIELMRRITAVEFVWCDTLSAVTSIAMLLNIGAQSEMRRAALVVALHFAGVSLSLWILPILWYIDNDIPQYGEGWVLIGFSGLIQLYLAKDVLQSKMNHITNNDITWQSKRYKYITQLLSVFVPFISVIIFGFLAVHRTTEPQNIRQFARGIWAYVVLVLAYPIGSICIMLLLYLWSEGRATYCRDILSKTK